MFTKFLLYRPIAVTMAYLSLLILGVFLSQRLSVSLMPDIDVPEITIQVNYPNLSASQMENTVVNPIRRQLLQVAHVDDIISECRAGNGIIRLKLEYGTDMHYAFVEVNEKIDLVQSRLPRDMERPRVIKASAVDIPVFRINVALNNDSLQSKGSNEKEAFLELSDFTESVIKRRLEQLPEVAIIDISGVSSPELVIIPDTVVMYNLGVTGDDINNALKRNNAELGSILVREGQYQYQIRVSTTLRSKWDVEELVINSNGRIFRLKDLASVNVVPKKEVGMFVSNGQRAIALSVIKQSEARMESLKQSVYSLMDQLKTDYPEVKFELVRDQSLLLDLAIGNLSQSLWIGGSMAFLILFFFLKDARSPFLIGISIPASIIISVLFFYGIGLSINIISLSGLILGVGMMIDNSIIVIDNITQYLERGSKLSEACIKGTNEVIRPLLSSVLTTCAVFIPLIFLSGIAGALFYDQAIAVSIGLMVSLGVSITLLPVYFKLFYQGKFLRRLSSALKKANPIKYEGLYTRGYRAIFSNKVISWIVFLLIACSSFYLYPNLKIERLPDVKQNDLLLHIDWNENIHIEENLNRINKILEPINSEIKHWDILVGEQQFLLMKDHIQSTEEATIYLNADSYEMKEEIIAFIEKGILTTFPGATFEFSRSDNIFSQVFASSQPPLLVKLIPLEKGEKNNELNRLITFRNQLQDELEMSVSKVNTTQTLNVKLDYEKMLLYDVETAMLINELKSGLNENQVSEIKSFKKFVPVKIGEERKNLSEIIDRGMVTNKEGKEIPIRNLVSTYRGEDLKMITGGKDGEYFPFKLDIPPTSIENVTQKIQEIASGFKEYRVSFEGSIFSNRKLVSELIVVIIVSLLLLYFILAAQFESLVQPIIVLTEIPINIAGALFMLWIFDSSINIMSLIGIVVMSGIIINDSILKIDTINRLRSEGYELKKAIKMGGERRLKPILMTSLTTILALVPFLFSDEIGAALQKPLALTVIGGMTLGTIVSLYYVPLLYYQLAVRSTQ